MGGAGFIVAMLFIPFFIGLVVGAACFPRIVVSRANTRFVACDCPWAVKDHMVDAFKYAMRKPGGVLEVDTVDDLKRLHRPGCWNA